MALDSIVSLQWRHNGCNGISNHQRLECLFNRLLRPRSKKRSKLHVTVLCDRNSPVPFEFPSQSSSNMLLSSSNRKYQPYPLSYFSVVVCLRCLLHHILSLIVYTFPENRDFVFIIIVQIMISANIRIHFGLQIVFLCLYITPSHYHHCANLSMDIERMKCLSDIFCRVCKIKHFFSVIHYTIYGTVCFQFTHFPCDDWENLHFVLLSSSNRNYELLSIV